MTTKAHSSDPMRVVCKHCRRVRGNHRMVAGNEVCVGRASLFEPKPWRRPRIAEALAKVRASNRARLVANG